MKDLIKEYLKKHYLENNEEERADRYHDETKDVTDEATRLDKSPKNIQEKHQSIERNGGSPRERTD